jgi:excisionase family DNA binding protein
MSDLLTTKELAKHLRVTPATVRDWIRSGRLTPTMAPSQKSRLFAIEDVTHQLQSESPSKRQGDAVATAEN